MLLPNHPNNTGNKPLLIGTKDQLESQLEYIKRGNYGLYNIEELIKAGVPFTLAEKLMKMKLYFAYDNILESDKLINAIPFRGRIAKIKEDIIIFRKAINIFEISYKDEKVNINLNLKEEQNYLAPYNLKPRMINREYFSIINSGNGDGWDMNRPVTGSIISFQGRLYLIDSGPNIHYILSSLGIDIAEIEGLFITHAHDDHFAGLTILMTANHKIKVYAPEDVLTSVYKKFSALTHIEENEFFDYFNVSYIDYNKWQNVEGLEVYAFRSPHSVETAVYRFRTLSNKGQMKIYAHNSDIASERVLNKMVKKYEKNQKSGISKEFCKEVMNYYRKFADVKKIDIGGGLIHGEVFDYPADKDKSKKKILAHTDRTLTEDEKKIGVVPPFEAKKFLLKARKIILEN